MSLSQPFSTNIVVGKVVNGVQFQSQRQFSGTKRKKVNNFSCLMFQAGENEMRKLSNHQIWRDIHLPGICTQTPSPARHTYWNLNLCKFRLEIK